ncbi:MAG: single-stranded-DNA-specific exonuclease RecJ [Clostridia bacterium]|nr:single-stranded-DNA-specific exonuclease RecJ [Clostridia bacterium]
MGRKKWNVAQYDKTAAAAVAAECGVNEFAALVLNARGFQTVADVTAFLDMRSQLSDPWLLKDMDKAVDRIRLAVEREEKITVFGDYDADGVTATALLYSYLEMIGADVYAYIPSRMNEGYGLSDAVCRRIAEGGTTLIVTVDNGIGAIAEAELLKTLGVDLVVTDHHRAGEVLPDCCAVVDPWRADDESPFKELAGVGVALKLAAALEDGDYDSLLDDYADIVAIGTVADIVPLMRENRLIVLAGLANMNRYSRCGIEALRRVAGSADKELNSLGIAFTLAPRINAAGRMGSAWQALQLLLTEDPAEAERLAKEIDRANVERQETESAIFAQVEEYLDAHPEQRNDRVLVVDGKNWHAGVIGIVASRLVERYGRPAIVITQESDGTAKGSGRSIDGFSLYEALTYAGDTLLQFGGHTLAAGFSVAPENIGAFRRKINEYAAQTGDVFPSVTIDCRLNPAHISVSILDALQDLEPFGAGNPAPLFGLFGMEIDSIKGMGNNRHLRLVLSRNGAHITAVQFGMSPDDFAYKKGDLVDLAVRIDKNIYMGETRVSIQIRDIRPAGIDDNALFSSLALFRRVCRKEELTENQRAQACPDRALITKIYKYIRTNGEWKFDTEVLSVRLDEVPQRACAISVALQALLQAGILQYRDGVYACTQKAGKTDLTQTEILKRLGYTE